jgi:NADPH2:quinone reductase
LARRRRAISPLYRHTCAPPINYRTTDFVEEIKALTGDGVNIVFDGIGGAHVWRSFKALRPRGRVVAYGLTSSLSGGKLAGGLRHRFRGLSRIAGYMALSFFLPGKRRVMVYSIQNFKRWRPDCFREDLSTLFNLLLKRKIEPIIAERIPLTEARRAHELLGKGSVRGKIVLICS